jgi:acetyl-CoA carboxylase biotin carboxyl carrier protein
VNNAFGSLSDDEVRQIAELVETLDHSTFDFLQLEIGELKLTIGKGTAPLTSGAIAPVAAVRLPLPAPAAPLPAAPVATPAAAASSPPAAKATAPAQDGTVAIVAPIMGRFYAQSEPGAAPFVTVGAMVRNETTVALIEVMKVFNAVPAGVSGVVTEICVQDAEIIEYGQVMFRVRPTETALADVPIIA